jgi:hypothetical protein
MYSTFAVQSGESARQQRLVLVLPYVLLWSNRAVVSLENDDSWTNPQPIRLLRRTRRKVEAPRLFTRNLRLDCRKRERQFAGKHCKLASLLKQRRIPAASGKCGARETESTSWVTRIS